MTAKTYKTWRMRMRVVCWGVGTVEHPEMVEATATNAWDAERIAVAKVRGSYGENFRSAYAVTKRRVKTG